VADRDPWPHSSVPVSVGSWTPTTVYRRATLGAPPDQVVAFASRVLEVPLGSPPSLEEARKELERLTRERQAGTEQGAPGSVTNGIDNQRRWLASTIRAIETGQVASNVEVEVWAARIGEGAILGVSAELFGEIGAAIRAGSSSTTLVAGCCNGVLGYVPTATEYAFGGFEVLAAHRVYGQPAAVAPETAGMIAAAARDLLAGIWARG
jgi:molybdopterin-binding protein